VTQITTKLMVSSVARVPSDFVNIGCVVFVQFQITYKLALVTLMKL